MRLIDADKLKEKIKDHTGLLHSNGEGELAYYTKNVLIMKAIDEAPTIQPHGIDKDRLIRDLNLNTNYGFYGEFTDGSEIAFTLRELMTIINQQPTSDGWIPVSERLPEDPQMDCYITINNGCTMFTYKGRYSSDACWRFLSGYPVDAEVTAWQPIIKPQPYKEGVKNE